MTDDGYRGYDINGEGDVTEFYDHRDDFKPPQVIETKPELGACSCCLDCGTSCHKTPCASIFAFILIIIGISVWTVCGILGIDNTTQLFMEYGPDDGNPATDPAPQWILGVAGDWRLMDPDKPGNYYPMVTERLKYCMYAIAPLTVIFAISMLIDGAASSKEFRSAKRGCKSTSGGICCSVFLMICAYIGIIGWCLFLAFNGLAVYYYRMVQERCRDRFDRGFEQGVYADICIDLVQIGLVQFKNTRSVAYGKICSDGPRASQGDPYGDLEGYCGEYGLPYGLFIGSLAAAGLLMLGFTHFSMTLSANRTLLQKKFSRPLAKHRAAARAAVDDDVKPLLSAPKPGSRMAPSLPGGYPPGSSVGGYVNPRTDMVLESRFDGFYDKPVRSDKSVDYYFKRC